MTQNNSFYSSSDLRKTFLRYFVDRSHTLVASSSLVPAGDKTLLFTNAGMVQFKDVFVGKEKRHYVRATSCQKCVRAGGKHNDLENVGRTPRHHTFFEMLGNFSFGDYFKKEAIHYAWEFLTDVLAIDPKRLWVTVHDDDDEAEELWRAEWKESGKEGQGISRCGADNFWAMGDTGPCGPCSEIFYDHGKDLPGDPPGGEFEGKRYVEIWNLVFMQFERSEDGQLKPLPKPSVDTGMGLERITAAMQGVYDNYATDLFKDIIDEEIKLWKLSEHEAKEHDVSLRVIADHIRATAFLITDSVVPSNEGRGYVLRRIMRRALRHLHKLPNSKHYSLTDLLPILLKKMGEAYPDLVKKLEQINMVIQHEEQSFAATLEQGLRIFNEELPKFKDKNKVPGELVFLLYDTYGFPPDLTADLAREHNLDIDEVGFEKEMDKQRARAKKCSKFGKDTDLILPLDDFKPTEFTGYAKMVDESKVIAIFDCDKEATSLDTEEQGIVILDKTPFYAESGGQVGDKGEIKFADGVFVVADTQKQNDVFLHFGTVKQGTIKVGDKVSACVDKIRVATMLNHSATHLLHKALRQVLGEHVIQKGSLVNPERLRFDFAHFQGMNQDQIRQVEDIVNRAIRADLEVHTEVKAFDEARQSGAMALFDEKYGDKVRIVTMGIGSAEFSKEFCGGTHVAKTGQIGLFKIVSEAAIASGIRRIEALTGENALHFVQQLDQECKEVAAMLKTGTHEIEHKLELMFSEQSQLKKQVIELKGALASLRLDSLLKNAVEKDGVKLVTAKLEYADMNVLRDSVIKLRDKMGENGVIMLAAIVADKVQLCCGVTKNLTSRIKAGDLVRQVSAKIDGSGGGKPDLAQGGGTNVANLAKALGELSF